MQIDETFKAETEKGKGTMVIFASGKGGVGKTVISVNTAVELADMGFSTCIMDGNFQFGDVNLAMDIQPSFTISDLVHDLDSPENIKISYYLDKHSSGADVLSSPANPEQSDLIKSSHIKNICGRILEKHDFLIVDLPSGLCENNLTFMEMAHKIFVVTDTSFAALKNTKTFLRTSSMLKMDNKVSVIINRCDAQGIIKAGDVQNMLDVRGAVFICNNSKIVSKSFAMGIPFVTSKPKEKISKDVKELAGRLSSNIK
ncbi:MAG: response regulator receiver protein [Clostridiaceae bacterium]|jgi:pilus assembly protein CpaE|nr:response regulator receiver protein [Clostridiaceae bacterium]